jgi:hypothetical protein
MVLLKFIFSVRGDHFDYSPWAGLTLGVQKSMWKSPVLAETGLLRETRGLLIVLCTLLEGGVGITTRYGLNGPGVESRCGEIFRIRPHRPWGPLNLVYSGYRTSFWGVKRPARGVNHPTPCSAEVKERVELYLYSCSGLSWPVIGWPLPLLVLCETDSAYGSCRLSKCPWRWSSCSN